MATTAGDFINESIEVDLRDKQNIIYTANEYLAFINRVLDPLYSALGALNSDWVKGSDDLTLSATEYTVAAPTDCALIREAWITTTRLTPWSLDKMNYERQAGGTVEGQPDYWAHDGVNVLFEKTADQEYTVTVYYTKNKTALASVNTNMPFGDRFNEQIAHAVKLVAKTNQEYDVISDAALYDYFFEANFSQNVIARNHVRKARLNF